MSSSTKSNTNKRPALTPVSPIDDWGAEVERSEKQEKSQRTVSPPPDPFSTRPTGRQPGVLILPKQMPPQESHGIQIRDYMGPSHYRNDWRQQSSSVSPPLADHFHPREARRREREQQSHMVEPYDGQDQYNYARAGPPSQRRVANDNDPEVQIARLKEMLAVNEGRMEQLYGAAKMNYSIDVNLMSKIRREIQDLYEQLLGFDQLLNSGLDEKIFRSAFYDAVEVLRLEMVKCEDSQALMAFQKVFLEIIQEGTDTFQRLLERYQSAGDFALVDFVHPIDDSLLKFIEKPVRSIVTRHSKALLKSCQRFLIALGDLARYKELELKTQNFGRSRAYYLRAAQLIPSNGHSFSQLGLLALYTHRRLDAIYYLSRSLCAKTPFSLAANPLV